MTDDNENDVMERPEYYAIQVRLLDCKPGNFDHADGETATIVTISRGDFIEPLVFPQADARELITKALIALATCGDEFAHKLLDNQFDSDDDGHFIWPSEL